MAHNFYKCESGNCYCQFKVKKIRKPYYIGMYMGELVFHHYYDCVCCGYRHTIRFYNKIVNPYYDRFMMTKIDMIYNRRNSDKYDELLKEYEIAKKELDKVNDVVRYSLGRSLK